MAINEVCQFELKEEIDKMLKINPERTLASCFEEMAGFYGSIGIHVKKTTIEQKYHRATKKLTNVSAPASAENPSPSIIKNTGNPIPNPKPKCACGKDCERSHALKDGTIIYRPICHACRDRSSKIKPKNHKGLNIVSDALSFAVMAISQLERIRKDDPYREEAFNNVIAWIKKEIGGEK